MKRGAVILVILACSLVCGGAILGFYRYENLSIVATDDATVRGDQVVVSPLMLGRITRMYAAPGERVVKGQLLVSLDAEALDGEEAQARSSLAASVQALSAAEVALDTSREDFARAKREFAGGVISEEQYDLVKSGFDEAQAEYLIASDQERLEGAKLAGVRTRLDRATINSPVDGIVARAWERPGDVVGPAQSIYTLYDGRNLWVQANVEETRLRHVRVGDRAEIAVDSAPGRAFSGRVEEIGAATVAVLSSGSVGGGSSFTKLVQRVPVRISIEAPRGVSAGEGIEPGSSAEVRVEIGRP